MTFQELECVVLTRDMPEHGLRAGDVGTVVMVYGSAAAEVEFVLESGHTQALVQLTGADARPVQGGDMPSVREVR
jgi:hypothetical protein